MSRFAVSLVLVAVSVATLGGCTLAVARAGMGACDSAPSATFETSGAPRLALEVARSDAERATGLMNRDALPADSGMVFVFPQLSNARFWMKDTRIPLSIAFVAEDGTILDIQDMQPESLEPHGPATPYLYAIEANQGWFASHGVAPGQRVQVCF